ncbi:MAG TPA: mannosyltransferase family protein, partial [Acidimicrobiales bacterium]
LIVAFAMYVAPVIAPGYDRSKLFFDWDAWHYMTIARDGYPPLYPPEGGYRAESAFFPLLPWVTRWVDAVTPFSLRQTAVGVALALSLASVVMLWFLAEATLRDERAATRAVVLLVLWPSSVVLSMFYSDGLFILLGAACLLALRRERWLLAGLAALLATASRPNAIALAPACGVAALIAWRKTGSFRPFVAPALAPLGMLGYFVFLHVRMGDFFLWFKAEEQGWGAGGFDFGRHFVRVLLIDGLRNPTEHFDFLISGLAGLIGIALLVWAVRVRLPVEQIVYAGVALVLVLGAGFGASIPRYVMDAFPLFFAPALRVRDEGIAAWGFFSAGALACFTLVVALTRLVTP